MPYITGDRRVRIEPELSNLCKAAKSQALSKVKLLQAVQDILALYAEDFGLFEFGGDFLDEMVALRNKLPDPTVGDINYMITVFLEEVVIDDGVRYSKLNTCAGILSTLRTHLCPLAHLDAKQMDAAVEVIGILRCCEHEFLRRLHDPYEDTCIERNGDCFHFFTKANPVAVK